MPNVGRPSRSCYECRQKRSKCDLKRPACGQCVRKNQSCSGYRNESDFRFRVESVTSFPSSMSKDRRKIESIQNEASIHPFTLVETPGRKRDAGYPDVREFKLLLQQHGRPPIPKSLIQSWDVHAVPYFMKSIKPAYDLAKGIFGVIPRIIYNEGPSSAVYYACNAVASVYLAQKSRSTAVKTFREKSYGTAIRAVSMALDDFHQSRTDGTLLAIWLLGCYELILCFREGIDSVVVSTGWLFHNQIITELMRRRGPEQLATIEGRNLFSILFTNMEMQAFMTGREWEDANTWISSFYKYCGPSEYRILRTWVFCHHCSLICSRIQVLLDAGDLDDLRSNVTSILQDVDEVETAMHPLQSSDPTAQAIMADHLIEPPSPSYPKHRTSPRWQADDTTHYLASQVQRRNFRMRLSYHVLKLLRHACRAPGCTAQEYMIYTAKQIQCVDEIHTLAFELLFLLNPDFSMTQDHDERKESHKTKDKYSMAEMKRYVKVCVDLDLDSDDKCTLVFHHTEDGVSVFGLSFGDEKEIDK